MRRLRRRLGTFLVTGGLLLLVYAALVVFWHDPVTDVYTWYAQRQMRGQLHQEERSYAILARQSAPVVPAPQAATVGAARALSDQTSAVAYRLGVRFAAQYSRRVGVPIGHIAVPRIGLSTILVQSTDYWSALTKGPGHYSQTEFPGQGRTVGVAGHRTTWSAPFRHIDDLRTGDPITLQMPYGTFTYRVTRHRIVKNNDWSIIRDVGYEQLIISACHPLYSASHRYVIFAKLVSIALPGQPRAVPIV